MLLRKGLLGTCSAGLIYDADRYILNGGIEDFFFFFFLFFFGTRVSVASFASRQNFEADNIRGYDEALFNITVRLIRANL